MLRPRIAKQVSQPFVCWQCLSRSQRPCLPRGSNSIPVNHVRPQSTSTKAKDGQRYFSQSRTKSASVETQPPFPSHGQSIPFWSRKQEREERLGSLLRKELRMWEANNVTNSVVYEEPTAMQGLVRNDWTQSRRAEFELEVEDEADPDELHEAVFDELVDLGPRRVFFRQGDLAELTTRGGRQQEIAIFVKEYNKRLLFYTRSGRWLLRSAKAPKFFVPGFAEPGELEALLPYLPDENVETASKLSLILQSPPRDAGKQILARMENFWSEADTTYMAAASILDNAHSLLADQSTYKYQTLEEMAERLLTGRVPKEEDGKFSKAVLYAVHRSVLLHDLGFGIPDAGYLRVGGQYEIAPKCERDLVNMVKLHVRQHRQDPDPKSNFHQFILKARKMIDDSRETRQFTTHGTLGLSTITGNEASRCPVEVGVPFTEKDRQYLSFFESWAGLESFASNSALHGIGSEFLRYINRYPDVDLEQKTAWTFLQEIGVYSPWESKPAYDVRLPCTGLQSCFKHRNPGRDDFKYGDDKIAALRRDWGQRTVFCIDDAGAYEIDDGLSIEATENKDEYWVHVHTADPAAFINMESYEFKQAEEKMSAIYFPNYVARLLSMRTTMAQLSLDENRPCLTYSMRMNTAGEILDHSISPGTLRNVLYVEPSVAHELVTGEGPRELVSQLVGSDFSPIPVKAAKRPLLSCGDINDSDRKDILLLHKLAAARQRYLTDSGGILTNSNKPMLSIRTGDLSPVVTYPAHPSRHHGEPSVRLSVDAACNTPDALPPMKTEIVAPFMIAAGEVAARWCHARGVPIPYRVTPLNPEKESPASCFQRVVKPVLDEHGVAPMNKLGEYFESIGTVLPATTPGPHYAIGADMYTKVTSPLRRFPDLIVQLQIEAALLEEAKIGQSLAGNTKEDFLPFSKDHIDALLSPIYARESLLKKAQNAAEYYWQCYFLFRAWKFGDFELPSPMVFQVSFVDHSGPDGGYIWGTIHDYLIRGRMMTPDWMEVGEVKENHKFEVEIEDIDLYRRRLLLKPVRAIEA